MRRMLLLAVGVLTLAFAVPAAASGHWPGHRHRHHHHARAHHARLEHFGATARSTDPGTSRAPDAGAVASFVDGVLTLTLADGSTVSGKVTSETELDCMAAGPTAAAADDRGGDRSGEDRGDRAGDDDRGDRAGDDDRGDRHGDRAGDDERGRSSCATSDLAAGAPVHEAILRIGSGGAEFKLVLLDKQGS